jgi:hypothetical protein
MNEIFNKYIDAHNIMALKHGYTEKALWGSKEGQIKRFDVILSLFETKQDF